MAKVILILSMVAENSIEGSSSMCSQTSVTVSYLTGVIIFYRDFSVSMDKSLLATVGHLARDPAYYFSLYCTFLLDSRSALITGIR